MPTQFSVYRRDGAGAWLYWTSSPFLGPSDTWRQAAWTTPPTPPDTTGVAAGLIIGGVGTLSTTSYHIGPVVRPPLISPGLRSVLEVGAVVAVVLVLLGVIIGLVHRRRRRSLGERLEHDQEWGPPTDVAVPSQERGAEDAADTTRVPGAKPPGNEERYAATVLITRPGRVHAVHWPRSSRGSNTASPSVRAVTVIVSAAGWPAAGWSRR